MPNRRPYNEIAADETAARGVYLLRYGATLRNQILGILRQLQDTLVERLQESGLTSFKRARFEALLSTVEREIAQAYGEAADLSATELTRLAGVESRFALELAGRPLVLVDRSLSQLSPGMLRAIAEGALIDGAVTREWWGAQAGDLRERFQREIREGLLSGENMGELVQRVRGRATGKRNVYEVNGVPRIFVEFKGGLFDTSTRHAQSLVRTAVQSVSAQARRDTYLENQDVVRGVIHISTLDLRTTLICIARAGKAWRLPNYEPIGHQIPYGTGIPLHWGERSQEGPVLASWEELGINAQDVPRGSRWSRLDGKVPADITMDDFLRRRTAAQLDELLGTGRADLFRAGKIGAEDLLNQNGRPLSLAELEQRYGSAA